MNRTTVSGPREVWPDERAMARAESASDSFTLLNKEIADRRADLPSPADFHRLPLSWYKAKVRQIKAEARARGIDGGILLTQYYNVMYATGLLHTHTERPFVCFIPMDQEDGLIWFYPYLDDELVRSWWCTEGFSYFDYQHADGSAPNVGKVHQGSTVNIFRWWGENLARLGYGAKTIGIDSGSLAELGILPGQEQAARLNMSDPGRPPGRFRPSGGLFGEVAQAMPEASFVDVYDILIRQRIVKDEMETALAQRAMNYFAEIHAFARNYLLERGPGVYDWEVANAAQLWGMHRIMQEIPQQGELHNAVGISVHLGCRSGLVTAYPHPNQARWCRVERGHALQFAGKVTLGGYGGELYRSFLIAPWSDWQDHVWGVNATSCEIQARESFAGNIASNVARAVHDFQVAEGCGHLVYHRPAHGEGMEGHQPPYIALGDYTVLQRGMHFSNEPGLFDPKNGFGFNHGNNVVVAERSGIQMGPVPLTREWCLLRM